MPDIVDAATRSRMMSGIRARNTQPEIVLRKALFARGFRYRINVRKIFGSPDLVFPRLKSVLFVHGCFWHGHDCHLFRLPDTRREFWSAKIESNRQRDLQVLGTLTQDGWRVCTVWECALRGREKLGTDAVADLVTAWLSGKQSKLTIRGHGKNANS